MVKREDKMVKRETESPAVNGSVLVTDDQAVREPDHLASPRTKPEGLRDLRGALLKGRTLSQSALTSVLGEVLC